MQKRKSARKVEAKVTPGASKQIEQDGGQRAQSSDDEALECYLPVANEFILQTAFSVLAIRI